MKRVFERKKRILKDEAVKKMRTLTSFASFAQQSHTNAANSAFPLRSLTKILLNDEICTRDWLCSSKESNLCIMYRPSL